MSIINRIIKKGIKLVFILILLCPSNAQGGASKDIRIKSQFGEKIEVPLKIFGHNTSIWEREEEEWKIKNERFPMKLSKTIGPNIQLS